MVCSVINTTRSFFTEFTEAYMRDRYLQMISRMVPNVIERMVLLIIDFILFMSLY